MQTLIENALLCCATNPRCSNPLASVRDGDIDWRRLWEIAEAQQIEVLVARAIDGSEFNDIVPEDVRQTAKQVRLRFALHNMAIHGELVRISKILHAHAIPVVPLKGSSLALRLFDDLGARRCGDIDILVPASQQEEARRILEENGYMTPPWVKPGVRKHAFHGMPMLRQCPSTVFVVELHWTLTDPHFVTIDDDDLWKRILAASPGDASLRPLPTEELLLFLAIHMSKHDRGLLRLLADIHQVVLREGDRIDWAYLVDLAGRWSTRDMAYFGLSFAAALLGTPVPPDVLDCLRPGTWKRQVIWSLTGPGAIMRPPEPAYLRVSRFRLAYCLMIRSPLQALRAYWQYMLLPPVEQQTTAFGAAVAGAQRPFVGLARTSLAVGTSIRDQRRRAGEPAVMGWCPAESD
jgi:hypothetical protein